MKRIAILNSGIGRVNRGTEKSMLDLARFLSGRYHVLVYGRRDVPGRDIVKIPSIDRGNMSILTIYNLSPQGLKRIIRRLHFDPREIENFIFSFLSTIRLLFTKGIDLVFVSAGFWGNIFCRVLRFFRGVPYISKGGAWKMSSYESARHGPNAEIVVNLYVYDYVRKLLPGTKIVFIPHGIYVSEYMNNTSTIETDLKPPIFLYAGALEPVKRVDLTIKAVSRLPKGSLIVLGDGELRNELNALGDKLLGANRYLQSFVSYNEIKRYYAICDVFTNATEAEAFGVAYVEAMAANKPVVTRRDRMRKYIIGDAGILCNPENIEEYANALYKASITDFNDKPLKQAQKFDWQIIGQKYIKLIEEVLNVKH